MFTYLARARRTPWPLALLGLVMLLAAVLLGPDQARAASPGAGMSLQVKSACADASELTTVEAGVPFVVCVISDPAPNDPIAGFVSEVLIPAEPETGAQCTNGSDDDGDGIVNDGCPKVDSIPEVGAQCLNNTDDEDNSGLLPGKQNDGLVNDGCPKVDSIPEVGAQCLNDTDDEDNDAGMPGKQNDGVVNDGCPQVDALPEVGAQCLNNTDEEDNDNFITGNQKDGVINDGCPPRTLALKWVPREFCEDEVQVGRQDLVDLAACQSSFTFLGGVGHTVFSEFVDPAPPLTVPTGGTTTLVEMDFTCNVEGSYKLTLTAAPDSPDGAAYVDLSGSKINVKTVPQDYDGDTSPNNVADTTTFECVGTVGGIAELPEVAGTSLETAASSNANLALVAAVATAMLLAFSGAAWYVSRRRFG